MNRIRILSLLLAAFYLAPTAQAQSESHLAKTLKAGVIRVGTTGDWNPMSVRDPATNSYQGFDIDVMQALAQDMGVTVEFVPTSWAALVSGLVADKYDITTSASITAQRIRTVGFTRSYYQVRTVPITLKANLDRFRDWEDIDQPGVVVATTLGTSHEQQVKRFFPRAQITTVEPPARDFQEVLAGRAAVSVTSNLEAARLVAAHPELARVPVREGRSPADLAFIVPQDDQVWINFLNHWIAIKENEGLFESLRRKWMPDEN